MADGDVVIDKLTDSIHEAQDKLCYFLMTASGAAIAYALVRTEGVERAWWMFAVLAAICCWGLSFYQGCYRMIRKTQAQRANERFLTIEAGQDEEFRVGTPAAAVASETLKSLAHRNASRSASAGASQLQLFLCGALLYVAGHVWRILA